MTIFAKSLHSLRAAQMKVALHVCFYGPLGTRCDPYHSVFSDDANSSLRISTLIIITVLLRGVSYWLF